MNPAAILADTLTPSASQWILVAAIVIAIVTVLHMGRRKRPLDGSPRQYRREIDAATGRSAEVKRDMEQLLVELAELSREINAQIDTKFAKLEQSISDADRRISALRTLIAASKSISPNHNPEEPQASARAAYQTPGIETAPDAAASEQAQQAHHASPQTADPRRQRIYALADRGMTAVQIAQELQEQVGEVELILNLRTAPPDGTGPA